MPKSKECKPTRDKNRTKHIRCKICSKNIRSENRKRHARTHKEITSLTDKEVVEELRARYNAKLHREERNQKIE